MTRKTKDHIATLNREMGEVKTDVCWLKKEIRTLGYRQWLMLSGIILSIVLKLWMG